MAMSKKHYEGIARRIKGEVDKANKDGDRVVLVALNNLACDLIFDFKQDNPRFDEHRFFTACGF